ncbi:hypothetical protein BpHYR1_013502, partial [Brachionus plicatilis]
MTKQPSTSSSTLTTLLTSTKSYLKYGEIFIENFCRIPVRTGSNGDLLVFTLYDNKTTIPQFNINIYDSLRTIYENMFRKFFGENFVGINVTNVKMIAGAFEFYIHPSVNITFGIQNPNLTLENLTSILSSSNIETTFKEYSLNNDLEPFLSLQSINGCNGTLIYINECSLNNTEPNCGFSNCTINFDCAENSGDSSFSRPQSISSERSTITSTTSSFNSMSYGFFVIEKFCLIPVVNDSNGD